MTMGTPGNESYQHLPERYLPTYFGPHNVEAVSRYDSATANDLKPKKGKGIRRLRISRSGVDLYLKSPRTFWMRWCYDLPESPPSPMMTLNTATGTLLEAESNRLRDEISQGRSGKMAILRGTPLEDAVPWTHPNDPDFVNRICGRPGGWRKSENTALPYIRSGEKNPAFDIYGELDEIFSITDEDGNEQLVIIDFKSKAKHFKIGKKGEYAGRPNTKSLDKFQDFGSWYRIQADFYQWHLRRCLDKTGVSTPIHPIAYFVYVNLDAKESKNVTFDVASGKVSFHFDAYTVPHQMESDWIEPTLDLMVDCLRMTTPPAAQTSLTSNGKSRFHHEREYGKRYHWLWDNYPSTRDY